MIFVKEGEVLPLEAWIDRLDLQSYEFDLLLQKSVFKPVMNKKKNLVYRLVFVGEIALTQNYIVSVPKCCEYPPSKSTISYIQKVLKKYFESIKKQDSVQRENIESLFFYNDSKSKEVEVYLTLKSYFLNKGIYKRKIQKWTNDLSKSIDWKKTLQSSQTYISDDSVLYSNPYTKNFIDKENFVSELFKAILKELSYKYEQSEVKQEILQHCSSNFILNDIKDNAIKYCQVIRIELAHTFNSDDLLILSTLIEYLEDRLGHMGDGVVRLFGTSSFHVIWEHICSTVFDNDFDELSPLLNQPLWNIDNAYIEKGKFIPDVMIKKEGKNYIIDAKYYFPLPEKVCGVSDLAKQFIYAQISGEENISNILVFPSSCFEGVSNKGYVSIYDSNKSELPAFKSQRIQVLEISFLSAVKAYIGEKDLSLLRDSIWASIKYI